MTNLKILLGSNIKIRRKACGLSQSKLAERSGTAASYISAIEAGRRFPSAGMIEKLALALEIDAPELFSPKSVQSDAAKKELEELVWLNIGQNLSEYISENVSALEKRKRQRTRY